MLYVTTRNKHDTYTVHYANQSDRGPDGGLYLPFRLPVIERSSLLAMKDLTFGQRVAQMLNLFFSTRLTGWDVDLCAGKNPVKLVSMRQRIMVAEAWHNHERDFAHFENSLSARICPDEPSKKPTSWMRIAIRIALLYAVYCDLITADAAILDQPLDIAVSSGDFTVPMAAWYARYTGLPIGNIICAHDNSSVWDLIHHGQVRTDGPLPENLERLICATLGVDENLRFCAICSSAKVYAALPGMHQTLRDGMYATIISADRLQSLIPSVYRTTDYVFDPQTAMAFGGLQDYRARTGESRLALLISERSPVHFSAQIASSIEISEQELLRKLGE